MPADSSSIAAVVPLVELGADEAAAGFPGRD
jgi:hypothetical protein